MGFERWLMKLDKEDRLELLRNVLDTLEPDEKYGVVLQLEKELKAMNYDWMMFPREEEVV